VEVQLNSTAIPIVPANDLKQQILESWRAHNRIMMFVIEHIPDDAMKSTLSARGGRDIARQLAHLHMVRIWHLEATNRNLSKGLKRFEKGRSPDKKSLLAAFRESGKAIEQYLQYRIDNAGATENFKRMAIPTLAYFIAHETHHRGNIVLTMKQSGFKIPDSLKWGIWDWNKFKDRD
jgi:uncharacterized damage-inducible protein DinB